MIEKLNQFAHCCHETTGASFTLTKLKSGNWQVSFVNKAIAFTDSDIVKVVNDAQEWLLNTRKPVETETKYTLYIK